MHIYSNFDKPIIVHAEDKYEMYLSDKFLSSEVTITFLRYLH